MDALDLEETLRRRTIAIRRVLELRAKLKRDNVPDQIEEGLFLGSYEAAKNTYECKRLNITHILTVADFLQPTCSKDVTWKGIDVRDRIDQNLKQYFEECFEFIDEARNAGSGVLVHCVVGKSRSVTVVVAYLMKKHGMSLSQALKHVKSKRPIASPNIGFISQLKEFEESLLAHKDDKTT